MTEIVEKSTKIGQVKHMVGLGEIIAYTMEKLETKKIYRRTFVHKILYFVLPEDVRKEIFIPYLYGPYSPGIQRIVQYLEERPEYKSKWGRDVKDKQLTKKVDDLTEFIVKNKISTTDLAKLAKLHLILDMIGIHEPSELEKVSPEIIKMIKNKSILLGWSEFTDIDNGDLFNLAHKLNTIIQKLRP